MFCGKCGSHIPDGSKFCPRCGAKVVQLYTDMFVNHAAEDSTVLPPVNAEKSRGKTLAMIHLIAWLVVCLNMLLVSVLKISDLMDWFHTYFNTFHPYIMIYFAVPAVAASLTTHAVTMVKSNNQDAFTKGLFGDIGFGMLWMALLFINQGLEGNFMNSVNSLMIHMITGIYVNNIWGISYLGLFVAIIVAVMEISTLKKNK